MRRFLVLSCVLAQVLVLAWLAAGREYIVRYGETVYLRTAPLDPRDPFRGEFVRLNYDISTIGIEQMRGELAERSMARGRKVFVVLNKGEDGLASLDYATSLQPKMGLFIRGRLRRRWYFRRAVSAAQVRYGIEQLYVEQGKGRKIEKQRGTREGLQIPLEVEVALSRRGTGVIKGYRWSRLGVQLEVLRMPRRPRNVPIEQLEGPLSPKLKVTLKNVSGQPLTLVDPGDHCAFTIEPTQWTQQDITAADDTCRALQVTDADRIELAPQQTYSIDIDLSQPRWHVKAGDTVGEIGRLTVNNRFRIVYRAPDAAALKRLSRAEQVWRGTLPTRAFNSFGRVD